MIGWTLRRAVDRFERGSNYDGSHVRGRIDVSPRAACLFSRVTDLLTTAVVGLGLATPAAARVSVQLADVSVYTMSPGRIGAVVAGVVGLIGVFIGGLALRRSAGRIRTGNGRRGAIMALVLGPISVVVGGLVVATADGGLGTGNGLGGGVVATVVGLISMALGGLALARPRRTA